MDTSSLAVIVGHWKKLTASGGTLALAGARYKYTKALWITGLADRLPFYESVEQALAAGPAAPSAGIAGDRQPARRVTWPVTAGPAWPGMPPLMAPGRRSQPAPSLHSQPAPSLHSQPAPLLQVDGDEAGVIVGIRCRVAQYVVGVSRDVGDGPAGHPEQGLHRLVDRIAAALDQSVGEQQQGVARAQ